MDPGGGADANIADRRDPLSMRQRRTPLVRENGDLAVPARRRLMLVPGYAPLTSSGLLSTIADPVGHTWTVNRHGSDAASL